ncbi:GntR family transcriptional regulator [Kibdelosporangium aridum]|uniref:DNA-binding transcriptional regulator, GntR family n=1 Tax=Kibdelosporangium aridum TaxID=2030 RepID=A0A1W2FJP3_KIBAR|nr:GntR family transcriptional regulator [Kibdelosporangium aridum]SMD21936.1 DNA-binding transcriptional regulator, GntR family [Kibdelosporangium aridum]
MASVPVPRLTPPPRTMLRDTVYESIKQMLMDHDLAPGARLSIDGIARQLQVSPTPVREAMTKLESDGLVAKRPHAGYVVASLLDEASLANLYEMRVLLEPPAAGLAAMRATDEQIAEMRALVVTMTAHPAGENYEQYRDFAVRDAQLHRLIAEASGNPLIADALSRLHAHTHSYRLYFKVGIAEETTQEHQQIVEAIAAHNSEAAPEAMFRHLSASNERLQAVYAQE